VASPVFVRELVTAPRRVKHYVARGVYVAALLMLMGTAWLVFAGTQTIRSIGDLARFGAMLFQILAPLQLAIVVFFAALFTASSISQEKDRRTLVLLLMTDLSNLELVIGKLLASMLTVFVLILAALPLFMGLLLVGGVDLTQVIDAFAVTMATALVAGSLGSTIALWREKTFQALAMTVLVLVAWFAIWEVFFYLGQDVSLAGMECRELAIAVSPWRAVLAVTEPGSRGAAAGGMPTDPMYLFLLFCGGATLLLNGISVLRVRIWNPSRLIRPSFVFRRTENGKTSLPSMADSATDGGLRKERSRHVWAYPVLWREMRTWAYGRRVLAIRLGYLVLSAFALLGLHSLQESGSSSVVLLPFFLISLFLINAQAVTAVSTERDAKTLDLLLVTDLTPKEFIFGKLGGVFYNAKEMVVLPLACCSYLWWLGGLSAENAFYVGFGLLVMDFFVAVLGLHCGLIHGNSRTAIATSLGTVFFLFIGIATCMRIMVAFSGSFGYQLAPFLAFMLGGGVGLYVSLGAKNASSAIFCAAFTCPFLTFWAIASYLQAQTLAPFLVASVTYVFTSLTMLIPAISEFDLTSGRSTED
jgi:ABC-type transport system involved in multi-copper enzyme maturation permease subunit